MGSIEPPVSPAARQAVRALAEDRLRANRFDQAIEGFAALLAADPGDADAEMQLGVALQGAGRHEEATAIFADAQRRGGGEAGPFLHAAVSLIALGRAEEALYAASEACHRAPNLPAAHYVYGQAFSALGRYAEAEQAFGAAAQLSPQWADAYVEYGLARYAQGAVGDAKAAMRLALRTDPHCAAAIANLAAFMRITGQLEEAEQLLRANLKVEPEAAGARLNLLGELLQEEGPEEALASLAEAQPPADPAAARHWRLQEALLLLHLRRPAEARRALAAFAALGPTPPALAPLVCWRETLIAVAEGDRDAARRAAEATEASIDRMGPEGIAEHAIMAHYNLAGFWSGQGERGRAFAHWAAGHRLLQRFQPFSRDEHRGFVDASVAAFSKARLAAGPRASNRDPAPVFVVGMPRSGTTLIEQILAAHRDVHGAGERPALNQMAMRLGGSLTAEGAERLAALGSADLDRAAEAYLAELHALAPDKRCVVDKMPGNFLRLGLVATMLPAARIIHCVRDPRDIGFSIFGIRFLGHHAYAHDLADLGWYIGEHDRLMAHWREALPQPILAVRLNDWVEDFEGALARVLAHLDLPPDGHCARFYELERRVRTASRNQVREPINARGLGRWRRYADELKPLIAELEAAGSLAPWEA